MSAQGPDFDRLVGSDLDAAERERLRRVHELLVAAGPPPDLPPHFAEAPEPTVVPLASRRRRPALVALAAAFGAVAFALGFLVAEIGEAGPERVVAMAGTSGATASIEIFPADSAGNWPMEIHVDGLGPPPSGRLYQLWLTKDGELTALCGSFLPEPDGTTVVPMNAPWKLNEFDGWSVVEAGSTVPLLTT